jgi:hypothetical protein
MKFKIPSIVARVGVLALVAGLGGMVVSSGTGKASAENKTAVVTLTNWVVGEGPYKAGITGGAIGTGSFTGEMLTVDPTVAKGRVTEIEALYNFKGSAHAFNAHMQVRMYNAKGNGTMTGIVTDGWMEGAIIAGEFVQAKCDEAPGKVCFKIVLTLSQGPLV